MKYYSHDNKLYRVNGNEVYTYEKIPYAKIPYAVEVWFNLSQQGTMNSNDLYRWGWTFSSRSDYLRYKLETHAIELNEEEIDRIISKLKILEELSK